MAVVNVNGVERVRVWLEEMILNGQLLPGDRLNELSLAAKLGVSRAHLREAVRILEQARLVRIVTNRGAYVRNPDLSEALELFDVRAGLARSAGRLAVLRASRAQINEIDDVHRQMAIAAEGADSADFHQLNLRFHALLIKAAANERLHEVDLTVRNELQLYIRKNVDSEAHLRVSCEEHGAIVSALLSGDADACGVAFELHILNGRGRLMNGVPLAQR